MDLTERLRLAIDSGELIEITYNGGSKPGAARMVMPLSLDDGKLKARVEGERIAKAFKLDLIGFDGISPKKMSAPKLLPTLQEGSENNISSFLNACKHNLEALGWTIQAADDFVHLYGLTKLGKPRKNPAIILAYEPFIMETLIDPVTGEINETKRETDKPWIIRRPGYGARASGLESAFTNLLKQASTVKLDIEPSR